MLKYGYIYIDWIVIILLIKEVVMQVIAEPISAPAEEEVIICGGISLYDDNIMGHCILHQL